MGGPRILMGVVGKPHGVRGLLHVHSYAAVPADLTGYGVLRDDRGSEWRLSWHGDGIAEFTDVHGNSPRDRDAAQLLVNRRLYLDRDRLPDLADEEFYLADLVGISAYESCEGIEHAMGTVLAVHDYGAGASLEIGHVGRSVMVPFTRACVPQIDLAAGRVLIERPDEIEPEGELQQALQDDQPHPEPPS